MAPAWLVTGGGDGQGKPQFRQIPGQRVLPKAKLFIRGAAQKPLLLPVRIIGDECVRTGSSAGLPLTNAE